jgi:hypothetical protein
MKKFLFIYLISILFSEVGYSQGATINRDDSIKKADSNSDAWVRQLSSKSVRVDYGCLKSSYINSNKHIEDSVLRDFFCQIDSTGYYEPFRQDTISELINLLTRAENDTTLVCLLPFYRILDSNAVEVYKNNCKVESSRVYKYRHYCIQVEVRYALIFYLHFTLINPIKLNKGEVIAKANLRKKDTKEYYSLTKEDYDKVYERYYHWLEDKIEDKDLRVDPLPFQFRWDVEIELKETGWYRKNENYKPIRFIGEFDD